MGEGHGVTAHGLTRVNFWPVGHCATTGDRVSHTWAYTDLLSMPMTFILHLSQLRTLRSKLQVTDKHPSLGLGQRLISEQAVYWCMTESYHCHPRCTCSHALLLWQPAFNSVTIGLSSCQHLVSHTSHSRQTAAGAVNLNRHSVYPFW